MFLVVQVGTVGGGKLWLRVPPATILLRSNADNLPTKALLLFPFSILASYITNSRSGCYRTAIRLVALLVLMPEYHDVACPGCGTTRSYPETMTHGGRKCSCGASYRIDTDDWAAVEIAE